MAEDEKLQLLQWDMTRVTPLYQEHCFAWHQGSKFLAFCANLAAGKVDWVTECPVIIRLKSFPAQFGSLLICSFMASPGQSQHDHTALLYLRGEVSVLEGSKTKCQGGSYHASQHQISPILPVVLWCH